MAGGRFELAMEPTAIGLASLNSNSETCMTAICDVRLIYGRGWNMSEVWHGLSLDNFVRVSSQTTNITSLSG